MHDDPRPAEGQPAARLAEGLPYPSDRIRAHEFHPRLLAAEKTPPTRPKTQVAFFLSGFGWTVRLRSQKSQRLPRGRARIPQKAYRPARGSATGRSDPDVAVVEVVPDGLTVVAAGETRIEEGGRAGSGQLIKAGGGTLVLAGANTHSGGTLVEEGTVVVRNTAALGSGTLEVRAGATVKLEVGYGTVALPRLALAAGAVVDLGEARLTIGPGGADEATIRQWIIAGRNGGTWNGTSGIRSAAAAAAAGSRAIGYAVQPDGSATVVFTAVGDLNLDRKVDVFDLLAMDSGGRFGSVEAASWSQGDLNYDGRTNVFDILGIDSGGAFNGGSIVPPAPTATTFARLAAGIAWEALAAAEDDDEADRGPS